MYLSSEIYNQIMEYCFTSHSLPIANEKEFITSGNTYSAKKKRIILFYLGGITFAEIAAI